MRGSESSGLNSSQSLVLCGREKGGNSKEMSHSGYKGSEEGYTEWQTCPTRHPPLS